MRTIHAMSAAAMLLFAAAGCDDEGDDDADMGGHEAAHWGYDGEEGPARWGGLSTEWATCGTGEQQSPIDVPDVAPATGDDLAFAYASTPVEILNNGHTVQVNYGPGSTLTVGDHDFDLLQFHFHAHSEHTVQGESWPMEMHLVHADADGNLAVVGVLIGEGEENAALAPIFDNLPGAEAPATAIDGATVDASAALPADHTAWRYDGSLTTPPCSEGVSWMVLSTPITASAAQISAFTSIFDHNYRPVQPANGRI